MATFEIDSLMQFKDKNGNILIIYPITQIKNVYDPVSGKTMDEVLRVIVEEAGKAITLNDTVTSSSKTEAATANAVKTAYDKATAAETVAAAASTKATAAETTANNANTKATTAETTANNANTKATAAETAANNANTKATAAETAANNAANSLANAGGVIVQTATPAGNASKLWVKLDTGIAHYWNGSAWRPVVGVAT